ncbi:dehydrogenase/reductase sdr family member 11 [Holotrichia oblita]|uniref:Dehydrogenase/reductase sdr family member 11 n=1 Tax=Holotrichia oblita TaxID=644536 RepID=A0ACB9SGK0_HOLOL|nr:dehydrogenase/reductase sdr family member 11 [Holotrichia oblita]
MERWSGKVAIITGASAGMGAVISQYLVERGMKVVGLSRRIERIEELSKRLTEQPGKLYAFRCDISKEEDILRAFRWIRDNLGPVHVLINNAGLTRPTNLTDGSTEDWRKIFDVNVMATCICTREAVRIMKDHNISGQIINMNSVVGHYVPMMTEPLLNVYPASKFAVTALTETLRQELRYYKSKIKITSISPGVVRTPEYTEGQDEEDNNSSGMPSLKPEDVADAVIYILSTGPNVQVHELTLRPIGEMF